MSLKKIKILIIEDNEGDVMLIEEMLNPSHKFEVQHIDSISGGIEMLSKNMYDVILLDLGLPDGSGANTVEKIKLSAKNTPIIIITGSTLKRDELRECILRTEQYLVKGFIDPKSLAYCLKDALKDRIPTNLNH